MSTYQRQGQGGSSRRRSQNHSGRSQASRQGRPSGSSRPHSSSASRSSRNYRSLRGHDTGYTLRQRNINFSGGRGGGMDTRLLILAAIAVVILILCIFGITSCVRGCVADRNAEERDATVNTQDSRVSGGASSDVTSTLTPALDTADAIDRIAKNADQYSDSRMIQLAVNEPASANFVANYPSADKTAASFTENMTKGDYPLLYDWDSRWGYTDYADGAFGVTGSGPTTIAMAYMGLTGKNDQNPAVVGKAITEAGAASGEAGTKKDYFEEGISKIGLTASSVNPSKEDFASALETGSPIAVLVRANTLTPSAHWVLVTGYASDGSTNVYDPSSALASSHTWDLATIAADADAAYSIAVAKTTSSDGKSGSADSANGNSSSSSNSDSDYDSYDSENSYY